MDYGWIVSKYWVRLLFSYNYLCLCVCDFPITRWSKLGYGYSIGFCPYRAKYANSLGKISTYVKFCPNTAISQQKCYYTFPGYTVPVPSSVWEMSSTEQIAFFLVVPVQNTGLLLLLSDPFWGARSPSDWQQSEDHRCFSPKDQSKRIYQLCCTVRALDKAQDAPSSCERPSELVIC